MRETAVEYYQLTEKELSKLTYLAGAIIAAPHRWKTLLSIAYGTHPSFQKWGDVLVPSDDFKVALDGLSREFAKSQDIEVVVAALLASPVKQEQGAGACFGSVWNHWPSRWVAR
jgi:hypothetical protein